MSAATFTPGPWSIGFGFDIQTDDGRPIDIRPKNPGHDSSQPSNGWSVGYRPIARVMPLDKRLFVPGRLAANAALIAAAPDLIAALEAIVRIDDNVRPHEYNAALQRICEIARAAIAKANGAN